MKNIIKQTAAVLCAALIFSGCGKKFTPPAAEGAIKPVDTMYMENRYEGTAPAVEATESTFSSEDGLCVIEKKASYYDVTLDYEKGTAEEVGRAYGETLKASMPEYAEIFEPYIFENIEECLPILKGDYSKLQYRVNTIMESMPKDYRAELEAFAMALSGGETGYAEDGKISCDEACLISLIPDVLRPTNCSAVSLSGERTASGERLTARLLDWDLGSDRQMCRAHCVVHYLNGERTFTSIGSLGMLSVLTGINDDGLMMGEFDVGSGNAESYVCEGRTSYSYAIRHCLEEYDDASAAGKYVVEHAEDYTYCVNIMLTDADEALCAEIVCTGDEKDGRSLLRDGSSELNPGLDWDDPEVLCIVNSYAARGNYDGLTDVRDNIVRWKKFKKLFCGCENVTVGRFKELLCCEKQADCMNNIRNSGTVHMVIADYSDNSIQAFFAPAEGNTETPEFVSLGSW
ncbi:C45 family autoproteolytic acyltransferase/hydolase [Ruminococcus sp.]|uniref:C45 family autoproteolytic acyltransferase/hydolase n=1 Tax=Ruminococcus sp. TaxID=41978 RepID=UPI0025E8E964|nr:C45 family autoproteolytic acyltransferase/hydolase [Ruminococcus sp.]MBQ8967795.1 hypothetical protein [Ruminococcus sp.]